MAEVLIPPQMGKFGVKIPRNTTKEDRKIVQDFVARFSDEQYQLSNPSAIDAFDILEEKTDSDWRLYFIEVQKQPTQKDILIFMIQLAMKLKKTDFRVSIRMPDGEEEEKYKCRDGKIIHKELIQFDGKEEYLNTTWSLLSCKHISKFGLAVSH